MQDLVGAYTKPFCRWDRQSEVDRQWPTWEIPCQIMRHARIPSGHFAPIVTLGDMLGRRWKSDVHFTQYHTPAATRFVKSNPPASFGLPVTFNIACLDLDYGKHEQPPSDAFGCLLRACFVISCHLPSPNVVYQTKHGARFLYLIDAINDPDEFEAHYQQLLEKIAEPIAASDQGYQVDKTTRDWTRLFRAPHVVRSGEAQYGRHVRVFHRDTLDIRVFKVKKKERPTFTGDAKFTLQDRYLCTLLHDIAPGQRNTTTFKAVAWAVSKYTPDAAEKWIGIIADKARSEGMDESEIHTVIRSATNHATKGK